MRSSSKTLIPQLKEEAAAVTKAISSIGEVTLEKGKPSAALSSSTMHFVKMPSSMLPIMIS